MNALDKVLEQITEQQKGLKPCTPVWCVGEQLKEIAKTSARAAELLAGDLEKLGMKIADAEKKLKAYADDLHAKQKGNICIPPDVADRILREFYGLPEQVERIDGLATPDGLIDLSSFF